MNVLKIFACSFALFLFSILGCFGQEHSISGKVVDIQNEPVSYANVIVMKAQDSTIVKGTSTDDLGFYKVNLLKDDSYILKISFVGYTDVFKPIQLTKDENLEPLVLEESSESLGEVSIIVKQPTVKKEADRLVFNIENSALSEGNMFEVLKSTPGVLVIDGNIQVKNTKPTIFINNRKVHLTNDELVELLEGSSASSIKSVEVITNPSSKYDASSGAVINIVMSKNLVTGYRGNVFTNYRQAVFASYDAGMSHFFKSEKINFFANYNYSDSKINRNNTHNTNFLDTNQDVNEIWESKIDRNTWTEKHNFNFNFDYSFNDKNTLSLSSSILFLPYFKYKTLTKTNVFDADRNLDYFFNANNLSRDNKHNLGFDLDYIHRFKKEGEKLTFNSHYTTYDFNRKQNVKSEYFDEDDSFMTATEFNTKNNQDTEIFTSQADYTLPADDSTILEMGLKTSKIKTTSDITQYDIINGENVLNTNNTDAFNYDESIFAGYVNYSKNWEKLSLILGLRAEQTNVKGVSISNNETNKQDYLEWFPTASISYNLSNKFTVYSNYKRSIERADYQSLNPFKFFLNDNTLVVGNPNLQPVFIDHIVLGTSFKSYTIEAYHKTFRNNIFEIPIQDNANNLIAYTPVNLDKTIEYGFDFLTNFSMTKNWYLSFVTSFYNVKGEATFESSQVKLDQWSNFTQLQNNFRFLKDNSLSANFIVTYSSDNLQGLVLVKHILKSELSVSKSILNKKGVISLAVSDLFNMHDYGATTRYLNQDNYSFTDVDDRYVKIGFRYKFGNTNLETNQRTSQHQETNRLEKQSN